METLEKQLEEERQRAQLVESQRGAGTGKEPGGLRVLVSAEAQIISDNVKTLYLNSLV